MSFKKSIGSVLFACGVVVNAAAAQDAKVNAPPLAELQGMAEQGNLDAQYELAMKYLNGHDIAADVAVALKWLRKSVDGGHLRAEYQLGVMYRDGIGLPKDLALALRWLKVSAGSGFVPAQTAYDELFRAQLTREFEVLQASAQSGDAVAQYTLGKHYLTGQAPLAVNPEQAVLWITRAAEHRHMDAQYDVGVLYKDGTHVSRDLNRAKQWLTKASAQGHVRAKVALQDIIRNEAGTQANPETAFTSSASLPVYRAAMGDDINAQFELGLLYMRGEAVRKDFTRGVEWIRRAAEQEHVGAQLQLAEMNLRGVELQQNSVEAFKWYMRAAKHGDAQAQYMAGNLYQAGSGVRESAAEARRWFTAAAKQGHVKAKERLAADSR